MPRPSRRRRRHRSRYGIGIAENRWLACVSPAARRETQGHHARFCATAVDQLTGGGELLGSVARRRPTHSRSSRTLALSRNTPAESAASPPPEVSRMQRHTQLVGRCRRPAGRSRPVTPGGRLPLATTNPADSAAIRNWSRHCACSGSRQLRARQDEPVLLPGAGLVDGEALPGGFADRDPPERHLRIAEQTVTRPPVAPPAGKTADTERPAPGRSGRR